jgi:hypothetical protein
MPKHLSISQRLSKASSPEARAEVLADWVADWEEAQWHLLEQIEEALSTGNYEASCIAAGAFKNQIEKRFDGLETVLRILQEPQSPRQNGTSAKDQRPPSQT